MGFKKSIDEIKEYRGKLEIICTGLKQIADELAGKEELRDFKDLVPDTELLLYAVENLEDEVIPSLNGFLALNEVYSKQEKALAVRRGETKRLRKN